MFYNLTEIRPRFRVNLRGTVSRGRQSSETFEIRGIQLYFLK